MPDRRLRASRVPRLLILVLLASAAPVHAARFDPSKCPLAGRATTYNDLRLDEDKRPQGTATGLPRGVERSIHAAGLEFVNRLRKVDPELLVGIRCNYVFDRVYRIDVEGVGRLFVGGIGNDMGGQFFHLILYDPRDGRVSAKPAVIYGKWTNEFGAEDPLVKLPLVSSADVMRDRKRELVFEERVHNGTMYNGVVYHYFEVGKDLSLFRMLALETRIYDINHDDYSIIRTVHPVGPQRLRLDVFETNAKGNRRTFGYVVLGRAGAGEAFRVIERHPAPNTSSEGLISWCETSDDDFLKNGCSFWY